MSPVTVRRAKLTDLSEMVAFAKAKLTSTNYADFPFNAVMARRTLKAAMTDGDHRVWVTERDGKVVGLLMAVVEPMSFSHHLSATDLAFLADAGGDMLLDAFIHWCELRGVARIDMGISAGPDRGPAIARAMRRRGFKVSGGMFHMNRLGGDQ